VHEISSYSGTCVIMEYNSYTKQVNGSATFPMQHLCILICICIDT